MIIGLLDSLGFRTCNSKLDHNYVVGVDVAVVGTDSVVVNAQQMTL